jgi:hypothetical protein
VVDGSTDKVELNNADLAKAGADQPVQQRTEDLLAGTADSDRPNSPDQSAASKNDDAPKPPEEPTPKLDELHPFDSARGSNVVFVLDRSWSMKGEKSRAARRELLSTLQQLGTNKMFYVIYFPYQAMPAPRPLKATPENIASITNWLFAAGHSYGPNPADSVTHALQFNPDTVWLLSDGEFPASAAGAIRTANESTKAQIHTVAFYNRSGEKVMRQIADDNGGTYRFVPAPEGKSGGATADTAQKSSR